MSQQRCLWQLNKGTIDREQRGLSMLALWNTSSSEGYEKQSFSLLRSVESRIVIKCECDAHVFSPARTRVVQLLPVHRVVMVLSTTPTTHLRRRRRPLLAKDKNKDDICASKTRLNDPLLLRSFLKAIHDLIDRRGGILELSSPHHP